MRNLKDHHTPSDHAQSSAASGPVLPAQRGKVNFDQLFAPDAAEISAVRSAAARSREEVLPTILPRELLIGLNEANEVPELKVKAGFQRRLAVCKHPQDDR